MIIDERIQELTEDDAKKLLRRAVEEIAAGMACKNCAMRIVCGAEASEDDCMRQVLVLLAVPSANDADDEEEPQSESEPEERVIYYDPETMQIEE